MAIAGLAVGVVSRVGELNTFSAMTQSPERNECVSVHPTTLHADRVKPPLNSLLALEALEVLVEPVGKDLKVVFHSRPTVVCIRLDDQFEGRPGVLALLLEYLRLVNRDKLVGVAMDDQRWWHVLGYEVYRRNLLAQFRPAVGRVRSGPKRALELGADLPDPNLVVTRFAPVEKVGGWEEAGDRLHGIAGAVDGVLGRGTAGLALGAHRDGEVPARAAAGDSELVRVDPPAGGVMAHEANRPMDVLRDVGDLKPRLAGV